MSFRLIHSPLFFIFIFTFVNRFSSRSRSRPRSRPFNCRQKMIECSIRLSPKGAEDSFRRPLDCRLDVVVDQNQVRVRVSIRVRVRVNLRIERVKLRLERVRLWLERFILRLKLNLCRLDIVVDVVGSVGSNVGLDVVGSGARRFRRPLNSCFHLFPSSLFSIFFSPSLLHRYFDDVLSTCLTSVTITSSNLCHC